MHVVASLKVRAHPAAEARGGREFRALRVKAAAVGESANRVHGILLFFIRKRAHNAAKPARHELKVSVERQRGRQIAAPLQAGLATSASRELLCRADRE